MYKRIPTILATLVFTFATAAPLQVVTSFSLLRDIVEQVGGDLVEIHSMVPMGTDPHEYQPLPADIIAVTRADIVFWNGLDMETSDGWFQKLINVAHKEFHTPQVVAMAEYIEPLHLAEGSPAVNPHAFISPRGGIAYTKRTLAALQIIDPENSATYAENAANFIANLEHLDAQYSEAFEAIPQERRIVITSERAFQYLAEDYNLAEGFLWAIDTDENGSPAQISSLIQFIRANKVSGLLVETNVDPRPMRTVSSETGVPIVGEVYSDELGPKGSPGETYVTYLVYNLEMLLRAMQ